MEQNKLEKQFKEKLDYREIKPTEMAWDRLNAMLSVTEPSDTKQINQKPKRKLTWLYIAASFIGFLLISSVFLNQKENTIDIQKNKVVIENTIQNESSETEIPSIKKEPSFSKTVINSETKPSVQTKIITKTSVATKTQENAVAKINLNNQNQPTTEHKIAVQENIESLLASAEKNPKSNVKNSFVTVNSVDLLNQVDAELQLSFREQALNSITQKYKEAKQALVNRNYQ